MRMVSSLPRRWLGRLLAVVVVSLGCPADDGSEPGTLTLAVNPTNATVQQGGSTPLAATATSGGGFSGTVTFAITGVPAGVTAAVSNVLASGATTTATVTIQAAASTVPGTYNITVRAQGSGVADGTAAFALTVTPTPDYTLALAPAALTINQGANGSSTVTITRTNFAGAVTLIVANAPAGVTAAFVPAAPTGTSSTVTVSVAPSVAPGTYNLTVDGSGAPGNRSTPLVLTVTPAPDYALSLAPAALSVVQGETGASTVTITRTNFTGAVTLSMGGAPAGVTGAFVPAAPTGISSTLTVTVAASAAPGTYNLTVDGTGAPGNRSAALTLTVTAAPPDYALSLAPTSLTIAQNANGTTTVTVTRTNFTDAVTLSLGGAPAGVTGAFVPAAPTGTSSTLTVTVAASAGPGTYNLTVDGTGAPGNRSAALTLTVTAAPDYALSVAPAALTVAPNASGNATVTIARTNFTGAVTLGLGGAPAGVTGSFAPAAPTGTSSTLTVSVGPAVPAGNYNLTVDGSATPGSRSAALALTVTTGGGGSSVTVSFAGCSSSERPGWFAYRDGTGPWTRVIGTGDVYTFTIVSATGGVAFVSGIGDEPGVQVHYRTQAELAAGALTFCPPPPPPGRFITGTFAGVSASEYAYLSLGGRGVAPNFGSVPFQIGGVPDGTHDLVGFRTNPFAPGTAERGLLRRDVSVTQNSSLGTVDFTGPESFAPATATITIGGLAGGETLGYNTLYQVGAACEQATLLTGGIAGTSFNAQGVPAGQQRGTDFHRLLVFAHSDNSGNPVETRTVSESFQALTARTVTLGGVLGSPTITSLGGPYLRLQAVYTLPPDYQQRTSFGYDAVIVSATYEYLGGGSVTLGMPDFSGVAGWDNAWVTGAVTAEWSIFGVGGTAGSLCVENARMVTVGRNGTF